MTEARDAEFRNRGWNEQEEMELARLYPRFPARELAPRLNRTEGAIYRKAAEMKVSKQKSSRRKDETEEEDELRSPFVSRAFVRCKPCGHPKSRMTQFGMCLPCARKAGLI